jgi:Uma2 family endonuclease
MTRQFVLPSERLPARLSMNPDPPMSDDEYFDFCMLNPNVRVERTAQGEILIAPPAGWESDHQCLDLGGQLANWAKRDGRGKASGCSAEFILPTGAAFSPDAAWVSNARLAALSKDQRRKFPHLCPEFVVEVMSPSDRLRAAMDKMQEWMRGGVELAWLIHADERTVYIYRSGAAAPEERAGITKLAGEGPVAGFELDLTSIWPEE